MRDLVSKNIFTNVKSKYGSFKLKDGKYLFFLGDIVDRGPYGMELMTLISLLKLNNYDRVYIINGNHEDFFTYKKFGYTQEIFYQVPIKNLLGNDGKLAEPDKIREISMLMHFLPSAIFMTSWNISHISPFKRIHFHFFTSIIYCISNKSKWFTID